MKPSFASLALVFAFFWFESASSAKNGTSHSSSICITCLCLNVKPYSVDCDDMHLTEIPDFWKDLKIPWRFRIQGNSLSEVTAFPYLENLTSISFRYNRISSVVEAAFLNLTNLKSVDLSHNNITEHSIDAETFRGPYQDSLPDPIPLEELFLNDNKLQNLPKHLFRHLTNLTTLSLAHNSIRDISVKAAQALSELRSLKRLDMSYTDLRRLPDHFFAELSNLLELDLSGNSFIVVPEEIRYAVSLTKLHLNNHLFGIITQNAFDGLSRLEVLGLNTSMTLFRVENGAFGHLKSLRTLFLDGNPQLGEVAPFAFANVKNESIPLEELHLENNGLEYLPRYALPWMNLSYLNLQGNPWNCDCHFEWFAKQVIPAMRNSVLKVHVTCATPLDLMGERVVNEKVQDSSFVCDDHHSVNGPYGSVVVATIVVGTLLLVTGTIIFSYVLFRRAKVYDRMGENVKYRRTLNEDEEIVTSNIQY